MKKNVFIVILVMVVLGMGGYLVYDKVLNKEEVKKEKVEKKEETKAIKIDDTKDFVYDAEYDYDSEFDLKNFRYIDISSVTNGLLEGKTNIAVPYVNINSDDARKVNNEMIQLFYKRMTTLEQFKKYDNLYKEINAGVYLNYVTYEYNDYVSIIVATGVKETTVPHSYYYGYVFDTKTGKLLSSSDIAQIKNLSMDELEQKTKLAIDKFTKENDQKSETNAYTKQIKTTYSELHESINHQGKAGFLEANKNGIIYFLDNEGNLKTLVDIYVEIQDGKYAYLLDID